MDLKKDIKIRIYPFMALSKNLIEGFYIIGYKEKVLEELSPNLSEKKLELSLMSSIIADSSFMSSFFFHLFEKIDFMTMIIIIKRHIIYAKLKIKN